MENAKDEYFISPCHSIFFKKIDFYYKGVTRGDEGCMCRKTRCKYSIAGEANKTSRQP